MMMDDESISGLKKGPWTAEEDRVLVEYIEKHGHGSWRALPKLAGLNRCGKSCRLRWTNYLRPDIKRGNFSHEEQQTIINLHALFGNKWSTIAGHLPGRTDNEIKNFWNTHLKKKLLEMGLDPVTHSPRSHHDNTNLIHILLSNLQHLLAAANDNVASTFATNPPPPPPLSITNWDVATNNNNNNNSNALSLALQQQQPSELVKLQLLHDSLVQVLNLETLMNPSVTDHLLHELLGGGGAGGQNNSKLQGFYGNFASHCQSNQLLPPNCNNLTNFEAPIHPSSDNGGDEYFPKMPMPYYYNSFDPSASASPSTSLPNLVSASPHDQCSPPSLKKMKNKVSPNDVGSNHINDYNNNSHSNNPSSATSTTFEMWGDLMGDEASPAYWKHLMDQESNQPWSIS